MAKPSSGSPAIDPSVHAFAAALERWIADHADLVLALRVPWMRDEVALSSIRRPVAVGRLSWDLWDELRRAEGADPVTKLGVVLGHERVRALRNVLDGVGSFEELPLNVTATGRSGGDTHG